jgi:hypothetical protein
VPVTSNVCVLWAVKERLASQNNEAKNVFIYDPRTPSFFHRIREKYGMRLKVEIGIAPRTAGSGRLTGHSDVTRIFDSPGDFEANVRLREE